MSGWKRTSQEVRLKDLPPEMVSAIDQHIEQYNLGPIISNPLMCIHTNSEKPKKGVFGKAETVQMGAVIAPRWLVWAIREANPKVTVLSAQLSQVTVQDYGQTPFAKVVPDSGIQVNGRFTDASENASAFIGLDESIAAKKFREVVIQAAQDAKK